MRGLSINVNTISTTADLPMCTSIQETTQDAHLLDLKAYNIHGWLHKRNHMAQDTQKYWPIRHELAMIDGLAAKGKIIIIIPSQLQILSQLHRSQMGIKMMRLLVC